MCYILNSRYVLPISGMSNKFQNNDIYITQKAYLPLWMRYQYNTFAICR